MCPLLLLLLLVQENYVNTIGVGYSCVLFALMVVSTTKTTEYCPLPGLKQLCFPTWKVPLPFAGDTKLPFSLAPFAMLLAMHYLVPKASFVGHFSGIVMGYPLAWNLLDWCGLEILVRVLIVAFMAREHWFGTDRRIVSVGAAAAPFPASAVVSHGVGYDGTHVNPSDVPITVHDGKRSRLLAIVMVLQFVVTALGFQSSSWYAHGIHASCRACQACVCAPVCVCVCHLAAFAWFFANPSWGSASLCDHRALFASLLRRAVTFSDAFLCAVLVVAWQSSLAFSLPSLAAVGTQALPLEAASKRLAYFCMVGVVDVACGAAVLPALFIVTAEASASFSLGLWVRVLSLAVTLCGLGACLRLVYRASEETGTPVLSFLPPTLSGFLSPHLGLPSPAAGSVLENGVLVRQGAGNRPRQRSPGGIPGEGRRLGTA